MFFFLNLLLEFFFESLHPLLHIFELYCFLVILGLIYFQFGQVPALTLLSAFPDALFNFILSDLL
jgi:hypothetical protein